MRSNLKDDEALQKVVPGSHWGVALPWNWCWHGESEDAVAAEGAVRMRYKMKFLKGEFFFKRTSKKARSFQGEWDRAI